MDEHVSNWQDESVNIQKNSMGFFLCNAESLRHKLYDLRCDVHLLDIVCVTKTWLDNTIPDDQVCINRFMTPECKDRQIPDLGAIYYGGVACYVRDGLAYTRRSGTSNQGTDVDGDH